MSVYRNQLPLSFDDNGDFWFPSSIIDRYHPFSCMDMDMNMNMDGLSHHFAAPSLFNHAQPKFKTHPKLERFNRPVQRCFYPPMTPLVTDHGGFEFRRVQNGYITTPFSTGFEPAHKGESYMVEMRTRAAFLEEQKNRVLKNRVQRSGGSVRESCGTGVFHPVYAQLSDTTSGSRRRGTMRDEQETQQLMGRMSSVSVSNQQDDCYYHLPPDMGLL